MKGYYHKIYLYMLAAIAAVLIFLLINSGALVKTSAQAVDLALPELTDSLPAEEMAAARPTALVLYDPGSEQSLKYQKNLERVFRWLDMDARFLDARRGDTAFYPEYDLVMVACSDWEGTIGDDAGRLLGYAEEGGRLLLGLMPDEPGSVYRTLYRGMGVVEYGDYVTIQGLHFTQELLPGSLGQRFEGEGFEDVALGVQVETDSLVLAAGLTEQGREVPVVWRHDTGRGRILTFNATAITGDLWTGVAAGCIQSLLGEAIWPVINTKTAFIDDFPSPQYNSESEVIQRDYNRTVREFFRDIWWPAMQSAAVRYNVGYVGLFIATYDDVVDPEDFFYTMDSTEQYFGNSLLDNGFEMGAHGYNHQSLALAGQVPADLGYTPWGSVGDMEASLAELVDITRELFPEVKLYTYVPPSNYLSAEGRQAVVEALPDLQVISGVYTMEGEEGTVCVQDFDVAADGVVEFPRATSGMLEDEFDRFSTLSVGGLYGVYSHFIHPDDILDEERGGGLGWDQLYQQFCEKLQFVNSCFAGLRPMTAVQAAGALRVADALDVTVQVEADGTVRGWCNGFSGQGWCYLRTEHTPKMTNESCFISPVSGQGGGYYYLVQIDQPVFSFKLE